MFYYIIENHFEKDGTVNTSTVTRQTFASGLSYFYERVSKMLMTELYTKVSIMLVDADLEVREHKIVETQYTQE